MTSLILILFVSFATGENISLFVKDTVVSAFLDNYLPFFLQSLREESFPTVEIPNEAPTMRLEGLKFFELNLVKKDVKFGIAKDGIKIGISNLNTRVKTALKALARGGPSGDAEISSTGASFELNMICFRDETTRHLSLTVKSCKLNLKDFKHTFSGGLVAGVVNVFTKYLVRGVVQGQIEAGICSSISKNVEKVSNQFFVQSSQRISLGQKLGLSLNYTPSRAQTVLGGFLYQTYGDLIETSRSIPEMPRTLPKQGLKSDVSKIINSKRMLNIHLSQEFFNDSFKRLISKTRVTALVDSKPGLKVTYGQLTFEKPDLGFKLPPSIEKLSASATIKDTPEVCMAQEAILMHVVLSLDFEAVLFKKPMSFKQIKVSLTAALFPKWTKVDEIQLGIKEFNFNRYDEDFKGSLFRMVKNDLSDVINAVATAFFEQDNFVLKIPVRKAIPKQVVLLDQEITITTGSLQLGANLRFNFNKPFGLFSAKPMTEETEVEDIDRII